MTRSVTALDRIAVAKTIPRTRICLRIRRPSATAQRDAKRAASLVERDGGAASCNIDAVAFLLMTEIVKKNDATTVSQDGWLVFYRVKRNDGHAVRISPPPTI
jgi:hypothetical protein